MRTPASQGDSRKCRYAGRSFNSYNFVGGTTLKRIEPHRLAALIVEDVGRYPKSKVGDIHERIGLEIPRSRIRRGIEQLVKAGKLMAEGVKSGTRYRLP